MKNIIITIAMFAIAITLIVAVILPLAEHGREEGVNVETSIDKVDKNISTLSTPIR